MSIQKTLQYKSSLVPGIEALSCSGDFVFPSHIHNGYVLWLNSEGGEHYTLPGCRNILQPGNVSVIEPGVVHSNGPCRSTRRHLRSLYLEEDFFLYLEKLLTGEALGTFSLPTYICNNRECWHMAILLHEAIINNGEQLLVDELIILLFSKIEKLQFGKTVCRELLDSSRTRIKILVAFMRSRLSDDISLDQLADIASCTSYHVIRLFKKQIGMSPHAYLIQLRLERARELLYNGQDIADAALLAGFSDQSHLTRRFKKRYGLTPGLYCSQKLL